MNHLKISITLYEKWDADANLATFSVPESCVPAVGDILTMNDHIGDPRRYLIENRIFVFEHNEFEEVQFRARNIDHL